MKFLLVSDYDLDYVGGAQTAFLTQAGALHDAGHSVAVMAPRARQAPGLPEVEVINPPSTVRIPGAGLPVYFFGRGLARWMRRLLMATAPDVVIVHSEFGLAAAAVATAKSLGIVTLHTVHTFFWQAPKSAGPAAPVMRGLYRLFTRQKTPKPRLADRPADSALRAMTLAMAQHADVVLSPSKHQAQKLIEAGAGNVVVLSNAAKRTAHARPLPRQVPLRLAWVGRFAPEKRLDVALEAMQILLDRQVPVLLEVAGGDLDCHPANVRCIGTVSPQQVEQLLVRSHLAVQTSLGFDNQPMVMIEACAASRGIVVSDPVLAREFGDATILASSPDAQGLADTLEAVVAEWSTVETAARAAGERASNSAPAAHVDKLVELVAAECRRQAQQGS